MSHTYYVYLKAGGETERDWIEAETEEEAIEIFRAELLDAGLSEPLDIRARPAALVTP